MWEHLIKEGKIFRIIKCNKIYYHNLRLFITYIEK